MGRLVHFEIHASDPARLLQFYGTVFGWTGQQWGDQPYWLLTTGPEDIAGINGAITQRRGPPAEDGQAVNSFVNTIDVDDLDATLQDITQSGGSVAVEKMAVPGVGWLAYGKDPDGNIFGVMQEDPEAD